jgi:hypothetical protein
VRSLGKGRRALAIAVVLGVSGLAPLGVGGAARASLPAPIPPACDPTLSGPGVPGCPSALQNTIGDVQNPSVQLPDLSPDAQGFYVDYDSIIMDAQTGQWDYVGPELNFDTWAQNLGTVPIDLQADDPSNLAGSTVSQCVSWTTDFVCRQRQPVGGFVWHEAHLHYHFNDFASYELRRLLPDGTADYSDAGLLASSPKVSFCLEDSTQVDPNAFPVGRYDTCNPDQEGISPGWSDIYPSGIEGQTLPLSGLSNGQYALVITLNPAGHVYETKYDNNRVTAIIDIEGLATFNPTVGTVSKSVD